MFRRQAPQEILEPNEVDETEQVNQGWESSSEKQSSSDGSDDDEEHRESEHSQDINYS